ncbi:hypothetical protein HFN80_22340 [Rhizobium laguerreae]|uniref:hypothetical protein n=1 Tax=Rhizobium laguerreae TaxID=1076926 RepID=UPI001C91EE3E|nr:hypothetical protein [Rhizobium laguerreae]MBY3466696.1 hypothetical protein [Rhizobium laguerreae]
MPFGHDRSPVYDRTLPPITAGVKSIPFNEIIRNLEITGLMHGRSVGVSVAQRQQPPTSSHPSIESAALVGDTGGSNQPQETDMRANLSEQKGNILHKDIQLHEHSVLPREEKLATP